MNLLRECEPTRGETLISSVLRYLILRSDVVRQGVLNALHGVSPIGPVRYDSHFSCYLEDSSDDPDLGRGRIDMVIETDDVVIGIEAKLFAPFQEGQPFKYAARLAALTSALAPIRKRSVRSFIAVVGPQTERARIENFINTHDPRPDQSKRDTRCQFLSWETLCASVDKVPEPLDGGTKFLWREWKTFLESAIAFYPTFTQELPHLTQWEPKGNAAQRQLVSALQRSVIPSEGPWTTRFSSGRDWVLCTVRSSDDPQIVIWFGFVSNTLRNAQGKGGAEFILITSFEAVHIDQRWTVVTNPNFCDTWIPKPVGAWKLQLEGELQLATEWATIFQPFLDQGLGKQGHPQGPGL